MTQHPDLGTTADPGLVLDLDDEVVHPDRDDAELPLGTLEATEADVAEQRAGLRETGSDPRPDWEAAEADLVEQRRSVGLDEDEYRT